MTTTPVPPVDVDLLREEIRKTYAAVSQEPEREFIFPTGRAWAEDLEYPAELANVPDSAVESFAGVANPFSLGSIEPGARVLDLGSGAGTDSLVAAQMVGSSGSVTGIDMTPEMLDKARATAAAMGADNVTFIEADAERLPFEDQLFRRRHLQWRDRPDPRQGRGLLRDLSRARPRGANPDRRRDDPASGVRGGEEEHRPLDWLNRGRSPGWRVRRGPRAARLRRDRARQSHRDLHALGVRGHAPESDQVRRQRGDPQGL